MATDHIRGPRSAGALPRSTEKGSRGAGESNPPRPRPRTDTVVAQMPARGDTSATNYEKLRQLFPDVPEPRRAETTVADASQTAPPVIGCAARRRFNVVSY